MTATLPSLVKLQPNPDWAKLPLVDRRGWQRMRSGDVVENINERVESRRAEGEQ